MVNTLRPRQNYLLFADDINKCTFLYENVWISINISLKFDPKGQINNILTLVQIMGWRRLGDKPLSEPMMVRLPTHICVTRSQWAKASTREYTTDKITTNMAQSMKSNISIIASLPIPGSILITTMLLMRLRQCQMKALPHAKLHTSSYHIVMISLCSSIVYCAPSQYKQCLSRYAYSHLKGKTLWRPSYLWHEDHYTGKTTSLYCDGPQITCYGDMENHVSKSCIKGRDNLLSPTVSVGCNYSTLPLIHASDIRVLIFASLQNNMISPSFQSIFYFSFAVYNSVACYPWFR